MSEQRVVESFCRSKVKDLKYLNNWFGATRFMGTHYLTGILRGCYFITCDHFMTSKIYSLKKVTSESIDTVEDEYGESGFGSMEEVKDLLDAVCA